MINPAVVSGRKGGGPAGAGIYSSPPLCSSQSISKGCGVEEVPSDQLPPQCRFKITLSWSKAALRSGK